MLDKELREGIGHERQDAGTSVIVCQKQHGSFACSRASDYALSYGWQIMSDVESLITGSEKLAQIFGYWPSFHDAEVHELHFSRGNIQVESGIYDFPVLTLRIHLWELTKQVDSAGFLVRRHHTLATLRFHDVSDFEMEGFNHQNAIMELRISSQERSEGPSPYFVVELEPAFGMGASFKCLRIEVVDAAHCTEKAGVISASRPTAQSL